MDNPAPGRSGDRSPLGSFPQNVRDEISTIAEQQRETLALLRQLIEMLLPEVDPDKPKLEASLPSWSGTLAACRHLPQPRRRRRRRRPERGRGGEASAWPASGPAR